MTVSKDIRLNVIAEVKAFAAEMATIPGTTQKQAAAASRKLVAELAKAESQAARDASKAAAAASKSWKDSFSGLNVMAGVISAAAIQQAASSIASLTGEMMELRDELGDASVRTGLATDTLAGLRLAAESTGLQLGDLESGLAAFPKRLSDAAAGTGDAKDAFKALGIDVVDVNGKMRDTDSVLREFLGALGGVENPAERAALATEAFGRSGSVLLTALDDPASLEHFIGLATEFGADVGPEAIQAAEDWGAATAQLGLVLDGTKADLVDFLGAGEKVESFTLGFVFMKEIVSEAVGVVVESFRILGKTMQATWADILSGRLREEILDYQTYVGGMTERAIESTRAFDEQRDALKGAADEYTAAIGDEGAAGAGGSGVRGLGAAVTDTSERFNKLAMDAVETARKSALAIGKANADILASTQRTIRENAEAAAKAHAQEMADIAERKAASLDLASTTLASTAMGLGSIVEMLANVEGAFESTKKAAVVLFRAQQVAALGQIAVDTFKAMIALALPPPIGLGPIAGPIFAVAQGAVSAAGVAAQKPPSFHLGTRAEEMGRPAGRGYGPGDRLALLQDGERVSTPEERDGAPIVVQIVQRLDHRAYGAQTARALRLGGPLSEALSRPGTGQRRYRG